MHFVKDASFFHLKDVFDLMVRMEKLIRAGLGYAQALFCGVVIFYRRRTKTDNPKDMKLSGVSLIPICHKI